MRITSKGQVTIPQHIRQAAGLRPNDEVEFEFEFEFEDGRVILRRKGETLNPGEILVQRLRGTLKHTGMSTDDMLALTRGED